LIFSIYLTCLYHDFLISGLQYPVLPYFATHLIQFVWEGHRQIWLGVTHVGDGQFSRHEHIFGFIEISPVKLSSDIPTDVKIVCGWPPLYFFFKGMGEHLQRNFTNEIYRRGLENERELLYEILVEIRDNQIQIANTVESLRRWARVTQKDGLPPDRTLRESIDSLAQDVKDSGGTAQYLEANLPLIPGIFNYKVELGTKHQVELKALWEDIIKFVKRS